MAGTKAVVLYSNTCGFCRWAMAKLLAWDRPGRLRPVAIQDPEGERLLPGMNEEERMSSWHLITPDGERRSGGDAIAPLLRLLPGGRPLASVAARMPRIVNRAYRFVADHRSAASQRIPESVVRRAERRIANH